jgi:hypothetical protein
MMNNKNLAQRIIDNPSFYGYTYPGGSYPLPDSCVIYEAISSMADYETVQGAIQRCWPIIVRPVLDEEEVPFSTLFIGFLIFFVFPFLYLALIFIFALGGNNG